MAWSLVEELVIDLEDIGEVLLGAQAPTGNIFAVSFTPDTTVPVTWAVAGYVSLLQVVESKYVIVASEPVLFGDSSRTLLEPKRILKNTLNNVYPWAWAATTVSYSPKGKFRFYSNNLVGPR